MKEIIIFNPSIEDGGVEKNLFLLTNFLSKRFRNISLITFNPSDKKYFDKKINLITFLNKMQLKGLEPSSSL